MRRDTGRESTSRRVRRCSIGQIFQNFLRQKEDIKRIKRIEEKPITSIKCCPHQKSQQIKTTFTRKREHF